MDHGFHSYPIPREFATADSADGPSNKAANPVLRGWPLTIAASLISSSNLVASLFFNNAGFPRIRQLRDLDDYTPCYNPAVIPILKSKDQLPELPIPPLRQTVDHPYGAADYHALYRSGKLNPTAVIEALLLLINPHGNNPGKHASAFLEVQPDLVRTAAEASTRRYKQGKPLGVLDGVPIAVKDEFDLLGYRKSYASRLDFTPADNQTSWCVKRFEEAGAIVIGKTSMHEMGLDTTNLNPVTGTPRNPHNRHFYTGGSSGGSGYAIAAGLVPIALGADGGGSIRIPSSFCGIYGIKPTHGRVSATPARALASTTGVVGPMASSLEDLMLAYRVMAEPDPDHSISCSFPNPLDELALASQSSDQRRYIGIDETWVSQSPPSTRAIFSRLLSFFSTIPGHTIVPISLPLLELGQLAHVLTILTEIRSGITTSQLAQLSAPNKIVLLVGALASGQDFLAAQRLRSLLMQHLAAIWRRYPGMVIASPTTPLEGWKIERPEVDLETGISDGDKSMKNMTYVWLANFTGCPAISWPIGETIDTGMPIGIMGMGEWGAEEGLFEWVKQGERFWESVDGAAIGDVEESGIRRLRSPREKRDGTWADDMSVMLN